MKLNKGIIRLCLLLALSFQMAYEGIGQKGWEAGAWIGTSYYFGDLNTNFYLLSPGLAGGINGRRNFNERLCAKASLNYGYVHADDANSSNSFEQQRNLRFSSHIIDFTAQMEFNFLPYVHGSNDRFFTPYLLGGFSFFKYNPKAKLDNVSYSLRDFGTEGQTIGAEYGSFNAGLTLGGGFKWDINEEWSINIEFGSRQVFTDYLDDVSTTYPGESILLATRGATAAALSNRSTVDGLGDAGRQRGNSRDNDSYNFLGISVMKYFGGLECPKISEP